MLYELRHYDVRSDRGLDFLNRRFADHTLRIWDRLGIEPVGFWTVFVGASSPRLTYVLAWDDLAQRQERWGVFEADPEWRQVRAESDVRFGGNPVHGITGTILQPVPFITTPRRDNQPGRLAGGVFELRTYAFDDSARLRQTVQWFETAKPLLDKHRMHVMGMWTTYIGVTPRLTYMLVFENLADRERAWAAYHTDPAWPSVEDGLYPDGQPLIAGVESCLMRGTEFSGWR
ncbi:MAG: NIPSNAP family protein [Armatimonadetes bacterium]|nr:NIPSNAP family protein [Armatimonadota bacterium]